MYKTNKLTTKNHNILNINEDKEHLLSSSESSMLGLYRRVPASTVSREEPTSVESRRSGAGICCRANCASKSPIWPAGEASHHLHVTYINSSESRGNRCYLTCRGGHPSSSCYIYTERVFVVTKWGKKAIIWHAREAGTGKHTLPFIGI